MVSAARNADMGAHRELGRGTSGASMRSPKRLLQRSSCGATLTNSSPLLASCARTLDHRQS